MRGGGGGGDHKGAPISLLAPGARNPRYATVVGGLKINDTFFKEKQFLAS